LKRGEQIIQTDENLSFLSSAKLHQHSRYYQRNGSSYSHNMLITTLSLPISQYYSVTINGRYAGNLICSKRVYSDKLQHRSLVKVQPL